MRATSVERWIKKWQKRLDSKRPYTIFWDEESHSKSVPGSETFYAEVQWGHAGHQLDIHVYPEFVTELDSDVTRERIILHELLHPILNSTDEDVVNSVVEILWKAYEKNA